jgi:hypothetical protein
MLIPKVHKIEPLTDEDWERVFELHLDYKRGKGLSEEEHDLCWNAFLSDKKRYAKMEKKLNDTIT